MRGLLVGMMLLSGCTADMTGDDDGVDSQQAAATVLQGAILDW
jgi:hypothetical protein